MEILMRNVFLVIALLFSVHITSFASDDPGNTKEHTEISDDKITITTDNNIAKITFDPENITILNIWVCNTSGKKLFETKSTELDLSNYASGTYFIQIKTTTGIITKKIIQ